MAGETHRQFYSTHYIDRSALLKTDTSLVKFIRNYIRDPSGIFSISSLVKILMTSFPLFHGLVQTVEEKWRAIEYDKKKVTRWLEDIYFLVLKTIFYERGQQVSKILLLPLENKIHILAPLVITFNKIVPLF